MEEEVESEFSASPENGVMIRIVVRSADERRREKVR